MRKIKFTSILNTAVSPLLLFAFNISSLNADSSAASFLRTARLPQKVKTWARLSGLMMNKTRRRKRRQEKIMFSLRFTEEMILAQLVVGDSKEVYSIGQAYSGKNSEASVMREKGNVKKSMLMRDFGIRPEDLTMSFLFWNFKLELPKTSIKGQSCRVFVMSKPNSDKTAKVYISEEYFFPLKVEWFSLQNRRLTLPTRTLEVDSFKKVEALWLIDSLLFYGPGWRTKIAFSKCEAGYVADGTPEDLFKVK
ncbi:MAG: outer membrane lipoprotein-sorting protein [Kiritimatiellaeota bacterium]|nr:outer membrane lipoprotein-sorting protein [Kiritimatiellota bacterium]